MANPFLQDPCFEQLEFTAYDEGKPVLRSLQETSPDGQTLTETYWHPGHEETKIVMRFRRLP
jgi:hypothetical protein